MRSMLRVLSGKQRWTFRAGGALITAAACLALAPAPSEAARSITPPQGFVCGRYPRTISISPPRVWSSYNRPEHVAWLNQVQRWNGTRWYLYGPQQIFWSTFNYYGQSVTSWGGGRFANSTLNLRVGHAGYYRVGVAINGSEGGETWTGFIRGGASCYVS